MCMPLFSLSILVLDTNLSDDTLLPNLNSLYHIISILSMILAKKSENLSLKVEILKRYIQSVANLCFLSHESCMSTKEHKLIDQIHRYAIELLPILIASSTRIRENQLPLVNLHPLLFESFSAKSEPNSLLDLLFTMLIEEDDSVYSNVQLAIKSCANINPSIVRREARQFQAIIRPLLLTSYISISQLIKFITKNNDKWYLGKRIARFILKQKTLQNIIEKIMSFLETM